MVRSIDVHPNGVVDVTVSLTTPGCPIRDHFQTGVDEAVRKLDGVVGVNISFDVLSDNEKQALRSKLGRGSLPEGALAQVKNVICVGSGKGGVGKSSVTANLAAALAGRGKQVGVMDADVWGYSQPRMFGLSGERAKVNASRKIIPLDGADGVKVVSIGFFIDQDAAVVWRGPMLHKALQQFLEDVDWGALDYLLIDLPPGTGDVSMTLSQLLPEAKFLIVTTPQAVAQKVAKRSADMAEKLNLEVAGVIENMAGFTTPVGRELPDLRRGRRTAARRGARRAAARSGAVDDVPARAVGQRAAGCARKSEGRRCAGDRGNRRARDRDDAGRAADDGGRAGARCARRGSEAGRYVAADGLGRLRAGRRARVASPASTR